MFDDQAMVASELANKIDSFLFSWCCMSSAWNNIKYSDWIFDWDNLVFC